MPRHGDKGRTKDGGVYFRRPRRLGGVEHEGHAVLAAERRYAGNGKLEAKYVRDLCADAALRAGYASGEGLERCGGIEKRRRGDVNVRAEQAQSARHGVMLPAGYDGAAARRHERGQRNVECVRGVHGKDHVLRLRNVEKPRRRLAAGEGLGVGSARRRVSAAPGACHCAQRPLHGLAHLARLLE